MSCSASPRQDALVGVHRNHVRCRSRVPGDRGGVVFVGVVTESAYPTIRFRVERMLVGAPATEVALGPLAGAAAKIEPETHDVL